MGSENLPTDLLNELREVNKFVEVTDENQITFTNKKRKLKPMREVAEVHGFAIENITDAGTIEKVISTKTGNTRTVKLFQGDLVALEGNEETDMELTVEEELEEDGIAFDNLEDIEDEPTDEEIDDAIEDVEEEPLETFDNLDDALANALEEAIEEDEETVVKEKPVKKSTDNASIEIQKESSVADYKVKYDGSRVHCTTCGYYSKFYGNPDQVDRIAKNHKC